MSHTFSHVITSLLKGQNWIKNFLTQVKKEEELKEESLKEFAQLKLDPNVRSKKGSSQ